MSNTIECSTPHAACCHTEIATSTQAAHQCETSSQAAAYGHHAGHHAHARHDAGASPVALATAATIHCLTGCAIGEFAGLAIGVMLGLGPWATMALATLLGFVFGFALGLLPLLRQGMRLAGAVKSIWLGEVISISVMELAMNFTDYHVGGVMAPSLASAIFWVGYGAALVAGFVAAWPVNYWMLSQNIKKPCH